MKRLYWRPHKVSRVELLVVAALAIGGVIAVEHFTVEQRQSHYDLKIDAARKARQAFEAIRSTREAQGHVPDPETDPRSTGIIGELMTPVTTNSGFIASKQISVNPNWAALVTHYLKRLDVQKGDVVAVGISGSFPAVNVAVYAALETIGAEPLVISSMSASQWGANEPDFMWIDMEKVLRDRGVFTVRTIAASRGGIEDKGLGISPEGKKMLDAAIERSGAIAIKEKSYAASVERRWQIYKEAAGGRSIKAYINVGGSTTSVGTRIGKRLFKPGINRSAPGAALAIDSLMSRFILDGTPVVHLVKIMQQSQRYGFTLDPAETPQLGLGRIFSREVYNVWLAAGFIAAILGVMVAFVRRDWGFRMFRSGRREARKPPEQMV